MFPLLGGAATSYWLPEHSISDDGRCKAESFMVYEIGAMLHVVMEGDKANKPKGTASYIDRDEMALAPFNFDHPIYDTPVGREVKVLIEQCTLRDPGHRPTLKGVIDRCQYLKYINNLERNVQLASTSDFPVPAPVAPFELSTLSSVLVTRSNIIIDKQVSLRSSLAQMRDTPEEQLEDDNEFSP